MYKMENVLHNVPDAYEARGSWKVGIEYVREGQSKRKRQQKRVKSKEESRRELGWRKEGVNGAEVWKLADRTGYAQTESQAQT